MSWIVAEIKGDNFFQFCILSVYDVSLLSLECVFSSKISIERDNFEK
jgi:hypothetical protein